MANTFLHKQLEFYGDSTIGTEQWKADHEKALYCYELEDKVSLGIAILDRICARVRKLPSQTVDDTLRIHHSLWQWYLATENLFEAANPLVGDGYSLDGLDDLRTKYESVSAMLSQMAPVVESMAEIKNGEYRPLSEAMNVLRSNYSQSVGRS